MIISVSNNKDSLNAKVYHNPFNPCYIKQFKDLLEIMNTQAVSTFAYIHKKRNKDNISQTQDNHIYFMDIDDEDFYCDEVEKILINKGIEFISVPSQSYPTKEYKKHFAIRLSTKIPTNPQDYPAFSRALCDVLDIDFNKIDTKVATDPARFLAPASANPNFQDYNLYSNHYQGKPVEIDFKPKEIITPPKPQSASMELKTTTKGYFQGFPIVGNTSKGNRMVKIPKNNRVKILKQHQHYFNNDTATLKEIKEFLIQNQHIDKISHSCPICNTRHSIDDTVGYAYSYLYNGNYYSFCSGKSCKNNSYVTEFKQYMNKDKLKLSHSLRAYHIALKSTSKVAKTFLSFFGEPHDTKIVNKTTYNVYYYEPKIIKDFEIIGVFKSLYHSSIIELNLIKTTQTKSINILDIAPLNNKDDKVVFTNISKAKTPTYSKKEAYLFKHLYRKRIESIELYLFILLYHKQNITNPNTLNNLLKDMEFEINGYIYEYENFENIIIKEKYLSNSEKTYSRDSISNTPKKQTKRATEVRKIKSQTKKEIVYQMLSMDKYKQGNKFARAKILQDLEKKGIKISLRTYERLVSEYKKLQNS